MTYKERTCKNCKNKIDSSFKECPICGFKKPPFRDAFIAGLLPKIAFVLVVCGIIYLGIVIFNLMSQPVEENQHTQVDSNKSVYESFENN